MTPSLRDSLAQVQELLGCPWCGKVPNIGPWGAQDLTAWPDATAIECSSDLHDCPVNPSVTGYTRAEAIAAWNTRAHSAEIAGALRDAERYRWLRAQNAITETPDSWTITRCDFTDEDEPIRYWVGDDLDTAIDSAMQQGGGGGEAAA